MREPEHDIHGIFAPWTAMHAICGELSRKKIHWLHSARRRIDYQGLPVPTAPSHGSSNSSTMLLTGKVVGFFGRERKRTSIDVALQVPSALNFGTDGGLTSDGSLTASSKSGEWNLTLAGGTVKV